MGDSKARFLPGHVPHVALLGHCPPTSFSCYFEASTMAVVVMVVVVMVVVCILVLLA